MILAQVSSFPLPKTDRVGEDRQYIVDSLTKLYSAEELSVLIGEKNHGFNSCIHDALISAEGKKTQDNSTAVRWQIIALDFDGSEETNISPSEVVNRLKDVIGLPNLVYLTKRNDPHRKGMHDALRFRVVYYLEEALTLESDKDKLYRRSIFHFLYSKFPDLVRDKDKVIDIGTIDENRYFYGGNTIIYSNNISFVSLDILESFIDTKDIINYSEKPFSKNLKKRVKDRETVFSNNIYIEDTIKPSLPRWTDADWEEARSFCPTLKAFLLIEKKIYHNELFLLYHFMSTISGGTKKWRESIRNNPDINDIEKDRIIHRWVSEKRKNGRVFNEPPLRSLYPDAPSHYPKYLSHINKKNNNYKTKFLGEKQLNPQLKRIGQIENMFELHYINFFKEGGKNLFKAPTATGKSTELLHFLIDNKEYRKGTVIAYPRHNLLNEKAEEFRKAGITFNILNEKPTFSCSKFNKDIEKYYANGFGIKVRKVLKGLKEGNKAILRNYNITLDDICLISNYFENVRNALTSDDLLLVTHDSALMIEFPNHSRLIFDEDPMDRIQKLYEVTLDSLKAFTASSERLKIYSEAIIKKVNNYQPTENQIAKIKNPISFDYKDEYYISELSLNHLGRLLKSNEIYIEYKDDRPFKLVTVELRIPNFEDILILSATPDLRLKIIFEDLDMIDFGEVELTGKLYQLPNKSFSKTTLEYPNTTKILDEISKIIGDTKVIGVESEALRTHLRLDGNFQNTSGTNSFVNDNLLIISSNFIDDYNVPIWADSLGMLFSSTNCDNRLVVRNNHEFMIRTYTDEILQEIHLSWLENVQEQAIGRARLASNKNIVIILSRVISPHPQTKFYYDYKTEQIPKLIFDIINSNVSGSVSHDFSNHSNYSL